MTEIAIVLLSGASLPEGRHQATLALLNRGFEIFTEVELPAEALRGLPGGFTEGSHALIAFNPLMKGQNRRDAAIFKDLELEKAAHLLAVTVENAPSNLRVITTAEKAREVAGLLLQPPHFQELQSLIREKASALETREPVIADLSRFKYRAKVELIDWNGSKAIKKTFRPYALDAMERERAFIEDMSQVSDVPARILAVTHNALVIEFVDNGLQEKRFLGRRLPVPLPLKTVRQLSDFVHMTVSRGWDPLDLTPGNNIMIDRKTGNLRAIDFEFAHRWSAPVEPEAAYFLSGVPDSSTVARPLNNAMELDPYPSKWRPFTGLSKHSFLGDPAWLQRVKRAALHPFWLAGFVVHALWRKKRATSDRDRELAAIALDDLRITSAINREEI